MPARDIIIPYKVQKQILKTPVHIRKRIITALNRIQNYPLIGLKLLGELSDYRKLKLGDYRIVYRFDTQDSTVYIVKIEHRQGVYK